ncbi:sensor histidine kinase [Radiobacillus kanasensis]|uniref:sensor histidine kinase n=1 Tax=Radiobacillus kanasensis TaxID=2844358 RepID=UPI001E4A9793|nr:sensor histidine kinase [Radiobacillus kanasensis]UFT98195.1 sensor histidine kinase [Radiobacillus kanasensis]
MFELMLTMLERLGIIVMIAFILTRFRFFRQMVQADQLGKRQQYLAILFFGFFGIIGTYSGLTFSPESFQFDRWANNLTHDEALANSRVIGVIIAGLLGGYKVGIGAGIIAGVHRFSLGGFTGFACGFSAIIAGLISGAFHQKNKHVSPKKAFLVGGLAEAIQMLIILVVARPFDQAFSLVQGIGIPMILANGIGSAIFLLIVQNVLNEEEKMGALQAQKALRLAESTVSFLRKGLNPQSAKAVCDILLHEVEASAISITDTKQILSHVGLADDHHQSHSPIQTDVTRKVIAEGRLIVAKHEDIRCMEEDCPLSAVIVAPLKQRGVTIGTLKFYFQSEKEITDVVIQLMKGLGSLLSNQLDISEADRAFELAKEAEIRALQAQISPHFLFNSLNIIVSLIRTNPNKARTLLVSLSHFLRQNIKGTTLSLTTLEQELKHVRAYLLIEEARFVDRLTVNYNIEERLLHRKVPPLLLQPIVENAVKHGIKDREIDCHINISIQSTPDGKTRISVRDNGNGISPDQQEQIAKEVFTESEGTGIGLFNVNRRLQMMYGEDSLLVITSSPENGTEVTFEI